MAPLSHKIVTLLRTLKHECTHWVHGGVLAFLISLIGFLSFIVGASFLFAC